MADWGSGGTPKSGVSDYYGGDIPWVVSGDLNDKTIHSATSTITSDGLTSSSAKWVPEGSVLVAMYGATIGKLGITGRPLTTNQAVAFASPYQNLIDKRFLFWYLRSQRDALRKTGKGGAQPNISQTILKAWPIPVPPLAEQHRIVEALEDHLSRLEAATGSMVRAKRRMRPYTASVLNRAALGSSIRRNHHSDGMETDCRRFLQGLSSKRFDYASLPVLPDGWLWRRSADVCESINSGSTPKAHLMHPGSGDVPFLKVYNITQDGRVDFTNKPTYVDRVTHESQLKRSRVRPGDVLTNIVGPPLGKTAVVPEQHDEWNINQAIVAFRAGPELHPEWLALALRSPFVLGLLQATAKATAGQFNVALSTCRELPLPVPPRHVQLDLVTQSAELLDVSDRFASQVVRTSLRAQHLRQALLRRAFTGQLVPPRPRRRARLRTARPDPGRARSAGR
ncbi:restriction endonuclease subunit S [Streptomyces goshikiensis]